MCVRVALDLEGDVFPIDLFGPDAKPWSAYPAIPDHFAHTFRGFRAWQMAACYRFQAPHQPARVDFHSPRGLSRLARASTRCLTRLVCKPRHSDTLPAEADCPSFYGACAPFRFCFVTLLYRAHVLDQRRRGRTAS